MTFSEFKDTTPECHGVSFRLAVLDVVVCGVPTWSVEATTDGRRREATNDFAFDRRGVPTWLVEATT